MAGAEPGSLAMNGPYATRIHVDAIATPFFDDAAEAAARPLAGARPGASPRPEPGERLSAA